MNRLLPLVFLSFSLVMPAWGQKVKYKDLFVLLNAKQFDQAEPFLKKYLKENDDNPNAFLFMAMIYQEKSVKGDVLKETEAVRSAGDSALMFYDKAKQGITEKELKKNDEYYEMYSRRDLRTGEFGIKLSDILLDIDKRTQALKERGTRVGQLKSQFLQIENLYNKASRTFLQLQDAYPGTKEMLLRSDEKTEASLHRLGQQFDSCLLYYNAYKTTLALLGKTSYNQMMVPRDIADLKTNVGGAIDFYADELKVFDFKKWAEATAAVIQNDVSPLRKELLAFDIEINKLVERVKRDSVSVRGDLVGIETKIRNNPVAKYDPAPMPLEVFKMKVAELRYASLRVEGKHLRDSSDLGLKMKALQNEFKVVGQVDSIAGKLMERNIEEEALNYQHFVTNAYGTTLVLKSLIRATYDYAIVEKRKREAEYQRARAALEWLIVDKDSIPLVATAAQRFSYKPLAVTEEKFTAGLKYGADSVATGYFFTITPSRVPDVKVSFPVDPLAFIKRNLPVSKALVKSDDKGQLFYALVYSETKVEEKFPVTVAKIYRTDGLAWSNNFKLDYLPSEILLNADTGDLSIKIVSSTGESKIIIVDKTGKLLP